MIRETILLTLKSQGVSQRRCALDCEILPQNFNNFLRGKRPLPLEKLEKVMEYLKIKIKP